MGKGLASWTTAGKSTIWFILSVCAVLKVAADQGITQVGVALSLGCLQYIVCRGQASFRDTVGRFFLRRGRRTDKRSSVLAYCPLLHHPFVGSNLR